MGLLEVPILEEISQPWLVVKKKNEGKFSVVERDFKNRAF